MQRCGQYVITQYLSKSIQLEALTNGTKHVQHVFVFNAKTVERELTCVSSPCFDFSLCGPVLKQILDERQKGRSQTLQRTRQVSRTRKEDVAKHPKPKPGRKVSPEQKKQRKVTRQREQKKERKNGRQGRKRHKPRNEGRNGRKKARNVRRREDRMKGCKQAEEKKKKSGANEENNEQGIGGTEAAQWTHKD